MTYGYMPVKIIVQTLGICTTMTAGCHRTLNARFSQQNFSIVVLAHSIRGLAQIPFGLLSVDGML